MELPILLRGIRTNAGVPLSGGGEVYICPRCGAFLAPDYSINKHAFAIYGVDDSNSSVAQGKTKALCFLQPLSQILAKEVSGLSLLQEE